MISSFPVDIVVCPSKDLLTGSQENPLAVADNNRDTTYAVSESNEIDLDQRDGLGSQTYGRSLNV